MTATLIVVLVLLLILLIPVGITADFDETGFRYAIKVSFLEFKPKPKDKPAEEKPDKEPKKKKKKKRSLKDILYIVKAVLKALGRLWKGLRCERLKLVYIAASDDPYKTAMRYNTALTVYETLMPLTERAFRIRKREIVLDTDFDADKSRFTFGVTLSIRIVHVLCAALALLFALLKLKRERKTNHGKQPCRTDELDHDQH